MDNRYVNPQNMGTGQSTGWNGQPPPPAPPYGHGPYPPPQNVGKSPKTKTMATLSLVFGVAGLVLTALSVLFAGFSYQNMAEFYIATSLAQLAGLGFPMSVAGLVLGIMALRRDRKSLCAKLGLAFSCITIVGMVLMVIVFVAAMVWMVQTLAF